MSDKVKLTYSQRLALQELKEWGRPYAWKPATMRRLAELGLAERIMHLEIEAYKITEAGIASLAEDQK